MPLERRLMAAADPASLAPALLKRDAALKRTGINPGTSADLTVASCLAFALFTFEESAADDHACAGVPTV
jgi:triphosphoribosyl-dephospho-CoA synthetase